MPEAAEVLRRKEDAFRHNLRWAGQENLRAPAHVQRTRRREHARWAPHHTPLYRGGERARRARAGAHRLARAPLPESNLQVVFVARPEKRDIRAVRKLRMTLNLRAQRAPIEIEIRNGHGALRIAHPYQRDIPRAGLQRQLESLRRELRPAHVHLEQEAQILAFQQTQVLDARAGPHSHLVLWWP